MARLTAWRKALWLHQWAKNALIFVPYFPVDGIPQPVCPADLHGGAALLGLMASGTYIINDILDLKADRGHHSKNQRTFASGRIKLWQGFVAALLILTGLTGGVLLSLPFGVTMMSYLVVTPSYSLLLKARGAGRYAGAELPLHAAADHGRGAGGRAAVAMASRVLDVPVRLAFRWPSAMSRWSARAEAA